MTLRAAPLLVGFGLLTAAWAGQWMLGAAGAAGVTKDAWEPGAAETRDVPDAASADVRGGISGVQNGTNGADTTGPNAATRREPAVATGLRDHHGVAVGVACMTCHATREPDLANGLAGVVPKSFHQGLVYAHGGQSCLSCHHADDYDALRLADGRKLAFADAQQLCTQCHGPQTRDYLNGSHGGMTGYWDRAKGERVRNACLDCHDPHAPAYPGWTPVFAPRDAAARQQAEREAHLSHE